MKDRKTSDREIDNILSRAVFVSWFVITGIWVVIAHMQTVPCLLFNWALIGTVGLLFFYASVEVIEDLLK